MWQRQTDNGRQCLHFENNRIYIGAWEVSFCHTRVLHLHLTHAALRETVNKSDTWILLWGHGVCVWWQSPLQNRGEGEHGTQGAPPERMKIAITEKQAAEAEREGPLETRGREEQTRVFIYRTGGRQTARPRLRARRAGGRHSALTQQLRWRDEGRYEAVRQRRSSHTSGAFEHHLTVQVQEVHARKRQAGENLLKNLRSDVSGKTSLHLI